MEGSKAKEKGEGTQGGRGSGEVPKKERGGEECPGCGKKLKTCKALQGTEK